MLKSKLTILISALLFLMPFPAAALKIPQSGNELAAMSGVNAQAYAVEDAGSGQILIDKNADATWTPASLTKLVTALVVLDTKPKFFKIVAMTQDDQAAGACSSGGACIKSKAGVGFTVDGLFHALLMPSANNAANALARSTGLSSALFAARMNKKAVSLGAFHSHFNEPTGMDPSNQITASDYVKIVTAAFSNIYLRDIASLSRYYLKSANNPRYSQTIKNTDKLLSDSGVQILGAKTGYLDESGYNFASLVKDRFGRQLAIVVLGEDYLYAAFDETRLLSQLADEARILALLHPLASVLGANTP